MSDALAKTTLNELSAQSIEMVEKAFLDLPQVSCPVIHRFGPGTYIREVTIPAGSFAIGHHQNFEQTNIMLKGRVIILNDNGTTSELAAPMIFVGKPGRKIGYIVEDMVWLNVYATDETDVEKLEAMFLTKSDCWLEASTKERVSTLQARIDQDDFIRVLKEIGISPETVRAQSENTDDMIELPFGGYKIKLAPSPIEGQGLFATGDIEAGEIIAPSRIDGRRTIAGRFTNHSITANAKMAKGPNGDIDLVATRKILGCHGGQDGEEITINYGEAFLLNLEIGKGVLSCQV